MYNFINKLLLAKEVPTRAVWRRPLNEGGNDSVPTGVVEAPGGGLSLDPRAQLCVRVKEGKLAFPEGNQPAYQGRG